VAFDWDCRMHLFRVGLDETQVRNLIKGIELHLRAYGYRPGEDN
jgi:hypothetical protein